MLDSLLLGDDPDLVNIWRKINAPRFDNILLKTKIVSAHALPKGIEVTFASAEECGTATAPQVYDLVLQAVGRTPNGKKICPTAPRRMRRKTFQRFLTGPPESCLSCIPAPEEKWQQGIQQGMQKGLLEGRQEGRQEGRHQGEEVFLRRLLTRRFGVLPEVIETRLSQANIEQLEIWGDRVLDAKFLNEVFQEH